MYCKNCGKQIDDNAVVCVHCGTATGGPIRARSAVADAPSWGYALLGFFVPIAGLILFLLEKDTMPLRAKSAGKGALVSVILSAVASVLLIVLYFVFVFAMLGSLGSFEYYYDLFSYIRF
jgi:hypothetical protein